MLTSGSAAGAPKLGQLSQVNDGRTDFLMLSWQHIQPRCTENQLYCHSPICKLHFTMDQHGSR